MNALTRRSEPAPPVTDRAAEQVVELVPLRVDEERPPQGRTEEVQQKSARRFAR